MKTIRHYLGALRLAIMGAFSFLNWASPSMGARQGIITAPTGSDTNLVTLGSSQPVRDTLMGVVRAALQLATALKIAIINYGVRKAVIVPSGTTITSVTGGTGMSLAATFVKDDATKTTSPWTPTLAGSNSAIEDLLGAICESKKPAMSVESLVNQIEDAGYDDMFAVGGDAEGAGYLVVVDQSASEIKVYFAAGTNLTTAATNMAALTEDVQFVQTLDSGGSQFGE